MRDNHFEDSKFKLYTMALSKISNIFLGIPCKISEGRKEVNAVVHIGKEGGRKKEGGR